MSEVFVHYQKLVEKHTTESKLDKTVLELTSLLNFSELEELKKKLDEHYS